MSDSTTHHDVCVRFFVELRAQGVRHVVVSPGSRSTPLALAAHVAGLDIHVEIDERVASFVALGLARGVRTPVVLVCSSGTAGANYHPAVIEAHHAGVPLIVCTADRPPELRQWGAGQTIDQVHLYGGAVRWFFDMPVASEVEPQRGAAAAIRAFTVAVTERGPVHLNWPFREPLEPQGPVAVPEATATPLQPRTEQSSGLLAELAAQYRRGIIVVGPEDLAPDVAAEILTFAAACGWPVVADPASGLRNAAASDALVVTCGELLFAAAGFTSTLGPVDVVVRVGLAPTSKAFRLWMEANPPGRLVLVGVGADWGDPTALLTDVVPGPVACAFGLDPQTGEDADAAAPADAAWLDTWTRAERAAGAAVAEVAAADVAELGQVAAMLDALIAGEPTNLVVSNSMPVRHVEFLLRSSPAPLRVVANRGANGIDGVTSTALGLALAAGRRTVVLIGDVAAVHDLGGLAAIGRSGADVTVVVIDNGGGAIFSILPVAQVAQPDVFEQLYTTPHGTDFEAVGAALGFDVVVAEPGVAPALGPGPRLVILRSSVDDMTGAVRRLRTAVDQALA